MIGEKPKSGGDDRAQVEQLHQQPTHTRTHLTQSALLLNSPSIDIAILRDGSDLHTPSPHHPITPSPHHPITQLASRLLISSLVGVTTLAVAEAAQAAVATPQSDLDPASQPNPKAAFVVEVIYGDQPVVERFDQMERAGSLASVPATFTQPLENPIEIPVRLTQNPIAEPGEAGQSPTLRTQPITPEEPPFKPERVPTLPVMLTPENREAQPGITILTPSAYTQALGNVSIGAGFQSRTRFSDRSDGVIGFNFGLGDPINAVGLDVGLISTSTLRRGPFDGGTVSFKLNRAIAQDLYIAAGVQNAVSFGGTDGGSSVYGVVTQAIRLDEDITQPLSRLYLSAGLGGGQFRSPSDINQGVSSVGAFGSVALRVVEPINAIAEWSGQDLTIGLSIVPFRGLPLVITPAITDITRNAGDGARFILGIGYGFTF